MLAGWIWLNVAPRACVRADFYSFWFILEEILNYAKPIVALNPNEKV